MARDYFDPDTQRFNDSLAVTLYWSAEECKQASVSLIKAILPYFTDDCLFFFRTPSGPDALIRVTADTTNKNGGIGKRGYISVEDMGRDNDWPSEQQYAHWKYLTFAALLRRLHGDNNQKPMGAATTVINGLMEKIKNPPPEKGILDPSKGSSTLWGPKTVWNSQEPTVNSTSIGITAMDRFLMGPTMADLRQMFKGTFEDFTNLPIRLSTESADSRSEQPNQNSDGNMDALADLVSTKKLGDVLPWTDKIRERAGPQCMHPVPRIIESCWPMAFKVTKELADASESKALNDLGLDLTFLAMVDVEIDMMPLSGSRPHRKWVRYAIGLECEGDVDDLLFVTEPLEGDAYQFAYIYRYDTIFARRLNEADPVMDRIQQAKD